MKCLVPSYYLCHTFLVFSYVILRRHLIQCGNGDFLEDFEINKKIKKYGIETSVQTVKFLNKRHKKIKFKKAYCHKIPFNQDAFDLVIVWSVLHWIDRNNYLQSLGELIRVTNKYLIVMDFFPNRPHKTKYKQKKFFLLIKLILMLLF